MFFYIEPGVVNVIGLDVVARGGEECVQKKKKKV